MENTYKKWMGKRVVYGLCYPDLPLDKAVFYVGCTAHLTARMRLHRKSTAPASVIFAGYPGTYVHIFMHANELGPKQKLRFRNAEQSLKDKYGRQLVNKNDPVRQPYMIKKKYYAKVRRAKKNFDITPDMTPRMADYYEMINRGECPFKCGNILDTGYSTCAICRAKVRVKRAKLR